MCCAARRAAELTPDLSIELVAQRAGFGSAVWFRLAFLQALNTTPSRYRREFGRAAGELK